MPARLRAVTGLRHLGDDETAEKFERMSAREYAEGRGAEIVEGNPRSYRMADLEDQVGELQEENERLQGRLDAASDAIAGEEEAEDESPLKTRTPTPMPTKTTTEPPTVSEIASLGCLAHTQAGGRIAPRASVLRSMALSTSCQKRSWTELEPKGGIRKARTGVILEKSAALLL